MKSPWIGVAAMLFGLGCAHVPHAGAPWGAQTVELELMELTQPESATGRGLDAAGRCEFPFANRAGRLCFEFKGGRVRADTNGDGIIDGNDAPAVAATGSTIRVDVRIEGRVLRYPLHVMHEPDMGPARGCIRIASRAVLQGTMGGRLVQLRDYCLDGRFDGEGDSITVAAAAAGAGEDGARTWPWRRVIELDGRLVMPALADGGRQLRLTPYAGDVAEVRLDAGGVPHAQVKMDGVEQGQLGTVTADCPVPFVPGQYRRAGVALYFGSGATGLPALFASDRIDRAPMELKPGVNVLKIGGPFAMTFVAERSGDGITVTEARVTGCAGENYRPCFNGEWSGMLAAYARGGGRERLLTKLEFGGDGLVRTPARVPPEMAGKDSEIVVRLVMTGLGRVEASRLLADLEPPSAKK